MRYPVVNNEHGMFHLLVVLFQKHIACWFIFSGDWSAFMPEQYFILLKRSSIDFLDATSSALVSRRAVVDSFISIDLMRLERVSDIRIRISEAFRVIEFIVLKLIIL